MDCILLDVSSLQTYDCISKTFVAMIYCLESVGFSGGKRRGINWFHPVKHKKNKGNGSKYADKHKQHSLGDDQLINFNLLENNKSTVILQVELLSNSENCEHLKFIFR